MFDSNYNLVNNSNILVKVILIFYFHDFKKIHNTYFARKNILLNEDRGFICKASHMLRLDLLCLINQTKSVAEIFFPQNFLIVLMLSLVP